MSCEPILELVEKSEEASKSVQTAIAICAVVGAEPPVGALTRLAVEKTDDDVLVNVGPSCAKMIFPGLVSVVKSPAVVSVQTAVAIAAAVGGGVANE